MTPQEFVATWENSTLTERASAQTHFNDLCRLLDVPTPIEADPTGEHYTFERHVQKAARGSGFADVWKRNAFAWEYKAPRRDLGDAYRQLLLYRDDLGNPPLLIVSDIQRIQVHTNFTGTNKAVHTYHLQDLLDPRHRADLRKAWTDPNSFDPKLRREQITQDATHEIGRIALSLRDRGHEPQRVAHFMMQLVFALFAEDTGLLPAHLVTRILERSDRPQRVQLYLSQLFDAMTSGGEVLLEDIAHFNGALFDGAEALLLTQAEINTLYEAAQLDWAEVEPAIFGTLFERSLDPARRSQLGAHYTSRDDILRIVEPVIMRPLRQRWRDVREAVEHHLAKPRPKSDRVANRQHREHVEAPISTFLQELHQLRVLDPACGSGNFLYIALQTIKDLEHEVVTFAEQVGAPGFRLVGPRQFYGIEINVFARELTSMVIWIGYLQWNRANGLTNTQRPILEPLENIRLHDALMNQDGTEYNWPNADYIIGNPPFLGDRLMRRQLGNDYVETLRQLFAGRIPGASDLVCYWFEKARAQIEERQTTRVGLIATTNISGGRNAVVLERILATGGIFAAWRDEPWVLDGASVRVSIVAFDDGTQSDRVLEGHPVQIITAQLRSGVNVRAAHRLRENYGRSFVGIQRGGPFDVDATTATAWLQLPNPDGASNADVLRRFVGGNDILNRSPERWLIDFAQMPLQQAQRYTVPFAHVDQRVRPQRELARRTAHRTYWWRHHDTRPALRRALATLNRYILTPFTSKHRIFVWSTTDVLPSNAAIAIAADDDFTFGVLHSRIHEAWSLAHGTRRGVGNDPRYTPQSCFETYPFPEATDRQRELVAHRARYLDETRAHLLDTDQRLTLTRLYNEMGATKQDPNPTDRAFPLFDAHERLDEAVANTYGWDWPLEDNEILQRLLDLNLDRTRL